MNTLNSLFAAFLIVTASWTATSSAQSSAPIIVQPANALAATTTPSRTTATVADAQSISAAIQTLEKIKAANDEVLAKQKAALEKLDELKEAADQLQIFAKRG
ncbi:MAG TPA: hypothetical protein VLK27_12610 [Chthoniobacterales bacterium]|nr:hypothetical protein [Chthoniobacterales bacterium]